MRTPFFGFMTTLLLFATTAANAQLLPPEPPQVTLGADLKLLWFNLQPVPNATFYRLWVKPGGASSYHAVGERIPPAVSQWVLSIPVHLEDWVRTRYVVTACNSSGCRSSAALNPAPLMLDAIGYLKASNSRHSQQFGTWTDLSDDGYTLAVSAPGEASSASGVNGDQSDNNSPFSGAVYVFRRRGNFWQQEAYIKAGVNRSGQSFGSDFADLGGAALSADGSMLAVSAVGQDLRGIEYVGAVYVFRRTGFTWSLMATLRSPEPQFRDFFGTALEISDDGRTLKMLSQFEGRTHIFVLRDGSWRHSVTLTAFHAGDFCQGARLSGDGQTLVMKCSGLTARRIVTMKRAGEAWVHASDLATNNVNPSQPFVLNADASLMALSGQAVHIYRWTSGMWVYEAGLGPPPPGDPVADSFWGSTVALNGDGRLLAVGAELSRENGAGISPISMPGTEFKGAVYLYQRNDSAHTWTLRNVVKSPNPGDSDDFGHSISLSASGRTLAVGATQEDSNARGVDGDRTDESAPDAGAAYLY